MIGETIEGRYEVISPLGTGGMARVFLARDTRLGREVAVKVLHSDATAAPTFVERFRREAHAVAALNHPNVVAVYDWGETVGPHGEPIYSMVMEYVPGETLKEMIRRRGPLPEEEAVRIASAVAAALEAAHRQGVVHRDIKPQNILIAPDGRVKVVDFGIAQAVGASQLTGTHEVAGTAHYLSPEQARRGEVSARSDIYSLGVVLYEMLTGRVPFDGESLIDVALRHVREDPIPPRAVRPDISVRTDAIVMRALSKAPERRYQSAGEMLHALDRAGEALKLKDDVAAGAWTLPLTAKAVPVPPAPEGDSRMRLRVLLGLPFLIAAVAVGVLIHSQYSSSSGKPVPVHGKAMKPRSGAAVRRGTAHQPQATPAPLPGTVQSAGPPAPASAVQPGAQAAAIAQNAQGGDTPADAVIGFYRSAAEHDFTAAAGYWDGRMRAVYPVAANIDGRFAHTTYITVNANVVSQSANDATVAVQVTESLDASPYTRQFTGAWHVVRGTSGWLLDSPALTETAGAPRRGSALEGHGHGHGKGKHDGD